MKILAESIERGYLANNLRAKSFIKVFGELYTISDWIIVGGERIVLPESLKAKCIYFNALRPSWSGKDQSSLEI